MDWLTGEWFDPDWFGVDWMRTAGLPPVSAPLLNPYPYIFHGGGKMI